MRLEPTYEGLEHHGKPRHTAPSAGVWSLPMRDWNHDGRAVRGSTCEGLEPTYEGLERYFNGTGNTNRITSLEPTYEGLERARKSAAWGALLLVWSLPMRDWNPDIIEVFGQNVIDVWSLPMRDWNCFHYVKTKSGVGSLEPTYEGLEPVDNRKPSKAPELVWSLPMRDWNMVMLSPS